MRELFYLYKGAWKNILAPHLSCKITTKEAYSILRKGGNAKLEYSDFEISENSSLAQSMINYLINRGFMLLNTYNFNTNKTTSYWYIIKDTFNGLEELSSNTRSKIRRSLKQFNIRKIDKKVLLEEGYEVYISAFSKYKVKSIPSSLDQFQKRIKAHTNEYEYWGCFDNNSNKLVAFSINRVYSNCCFYETFKALPNSLNKYPYYGLIYCMNENYLKERHLLYVYDGERSISEHSNIQPFLEDKFKFKKAYCDLQIYYAYWIHILIILLYPFRKHIGGNIGALLRLESYRRGVR